MKLEIFLDKKRLELDAQNSFFSSVWFFLASKDFFFIKNWLNDKKKIEVPITENVFKGITIFLRRKKSFQNFQGKIFLPKSSVLIELKKIFF